MNSGRPRVIFDCMVYLQAVVREAGPAAACLLMAENRRVTLFVSRKIIAEVREVLSREHIRQRFDTLTDESTASFIDRVRKVARQIKAVRRHFNYQERDVKDEPYINLAVEVSADYLISRDKDLLDLMRWDRKIGREFQKRFPFLKVVTPETFLGEMEKNNPAQ